jgi:hypothetical protein
VKGALNGCLVFCKTPAVFFFFSLPITCRVSQGIFTQRNIKEKKKKGKKGTQVEHDSERPAGAKRLRPQQQSPFLFSLPRFTDPLFFVSVCLLCKTAALIPSLSLSLVFFLNSFFLATPPVFQEALQSGGSKRRRGKNKDIWR